MLVGKNLVEEGHAYNRAKNMKLQTGIVEEALDLTDANQSTRHDIFKDPIELLQGMEFITGCPNINSNRIEDLWQSLPQMYFFDTA